MSPEEVVELCRGRVRASRRWLSIQDHDTEDLVQILCIIALRTLERFDPSLGIKESTFITHRVDGEIINWLRTTTGMRRKMPLKIKVGLDHLPEPGVTEDHDDRLDSEAFRAEVCACARMLPRRHRLIVRARLAGCSMRAIAARLEVSEARICQLCKRIAPRLRKIIVATRRRSRQQDWLAFPPCSVPVPTRGVVGTDSSRRPMLAASM